MRRTLSAAILMAAIQGAVGLMSCPSAALADPAADAPATRPVDKAAVPVKRVVLFSSGVGYFQHAGTVSGDATTELPFKSGQINDVLKSLVLEDRGGGHVGVVTYPSQDPIERTLKSFQVDITSNPSLADLLNQLRGAKITAQVQGQTVSGIVLGVEKKTRVLGDAKGTTIDSWVMNVLAGANIKPIALDDVRDLRLDDPALQTELDKALAALAAARDQDKKPVTISFHGQGERQVLVGYVVETPVWKTSYRLVLGEPAPATPPATQPTGGASLQGWAIVENQTDNDWDGIELSLVSGRPISFVQDLYSPLYVPRPVVKPEIYASLQPQTYEGGMADRAASEQFGNLVSGGAMAGEVPATPSAAPPMNMARKSNRQMAVAKDEMESLNPTASVASAASAAKLGELFQYTIRDPVSLPRQKSAMIPIVADPIDAKRVSIYNANVQAKHPLNGAKLKNTTGKHLLAGPVTVLDNNAYAGDARIDDVPPGQERLVSYGIDLQVLVDATKNHQQDSLLTGKIVKGVLQLTRKTLRTQEYVAENKGDATKTLIIEHPRNEGWSLVDTIEPTEKTDAVYRFTGDVAAGKSTKLVVSEQLVQDQTIAILPMDMDSLLVYSRTGEIPPKVRDALAKAIALKQAVAATRQKIEESKSRNAEVVADQRRIDETLKTINQSTDLYGRLMKKLDAEETELDKLKTDIADLTKQADGQQKELEDYLAGLSVE